MVKNTRKTVGTLTREEASRKNIPTAEFQSVMRKEEQNPIRVTYERLPKLISSELRMPDAQRIVGRCV